MKKLLILLFTIFLSIGSLSAQSADDIKGYIERANKGDSEVQLRLGVIYYNGRGVPQDFVQAHMWTNLAATQGSEVGKKIRDSVEKSMTPQQIAQAQELARNWKIKKEPTWNYNRMYPSQ